MKTGRASGWKGGGGGGGGAALRPTTGGAACTKGSGPCSTSAMGGAGTSGKSAEVVTMAGKWSNSGFRIFLAHLNPRFDVVNMVAGFLAIIKPYDAGQWAQHCSDFSSYPFRRSSVIKGIHFFPHLK